MKIGYPCINRSLGCTSSHTFRLKSYTEERFTQAVQANLECLKAMLEFNAEHGVYFFRISSALIPFASHPICQVDWATVFAEPLRQIGDFIRRHAMRVAMHPDQFTLINCIDEVIFSRSVQELIYHAAVLDAMQLDPTAKIQIHMGGVYGDRAASMRRFVERYHTLPAHVRRRLVVENDDRQYCTAECLQVSQSTGVPVVFDYFHEQVLPSRVALATLLRHVVDTWRGEDGIPIVDYSLQKAGCRVGTHAESLAPVAFRAFLRKTRPHDFDVMLEIKDKESSALRAIELARRDKRCFLTTP